MIYQRTFLRDLTLLGVGVFFILLSIIVASQSIALLGKAAEGSLAIGAVLAMIAFFTLNLLPVVLILTGFIAVLAVLTRYWRDSEMAVWLSSGLSLSQWVTPVLRFALPFAALVAGVSWWVTPWAQTRARDYAQVVQQKQQLSMVQEGVFQSARNRTYFLEKFDPEHGLAANVFVREVNAKTGRASVILAKSGQFGVEGAMRVLRLNQGVRYEGAPGQKDYTQIGFEKLTLVIDATPKLLVDPDNRRTLSLPQLLARDTPVLRAELMWRLSLPISLLVLCLLAIPLSYLNPRTGGGYNILIAVALFLLYENGLSLLNDAIAKNHVNFWAGLIPLHVFMLFLAWLMLRYRMLPAGPFWRNLTRALRSRS